MKERNLIAWTLPVMLALNFMLSLLVAIANPEAWFFGYKLEGLKADCWLLTNGIIGMTIGFSIIQKWKYGFLASFLFFLMNFVNSLLIPVKFFLPSPFFSLGLIISFLGLIQRESNENR